MNSAVAHDAVVIGAGQSGLAAARALKRRGLEPIVLEAGSEPVGSWPNFYHRLLNSPPSVKIHYGCRRSPMPRRWLPPWPSSRDCQRP
jgi:cation diffusion facilitator CzcD-associated flavoprotein CzcO